MKRKRWTVLAVFAMVVALLPLSAVPAAAASGLVETFDNSSGFTTSTAFFSDGGWDYFGITDGTTGDFGGGVQPTGLKGYTGFTANFLAGMDLDGEGASLPITIDWVGIDVAGIGALEFSGDFAEYFDSPGDIDAADYLLVEYQIDGGGYEKLLQFSGADFTSTGGPYNGFFREDTDFDGVGDGTALGDAAQAFVKAIAGTGSVLDLRLTVSVDSGDEDFAVDNFSVGEAGTPSGPADPVINEFVANHTGSDTQAFVEVFGDPSTDYSAFTVLEIEGDSSGAGVIDAVLPVGTTSAEGYWTDPEDMENGTITILLVEGFTGSMGADLDTDNSGVFDSAPWTRIVDDVATTDGGSSDKTYSSTVLAAFFDGSPFGAGGASRIPNGADTGTTADWTRNDFDGFGFVGFPGSPSLGEAVNTPGAVNAVITVITDPFGVCGDPATLIHDIQGAGAASTDVGSIREIEGVVVGDFDGPDQLNGFFVQEEDGQADTNPLTSEGIFVYSGGSPDVSVGDLVRVRGTVKEQYGLTELSPVASVTFCPGVTNAPTPATVTFPLDAVSDLESFEGMSIIIPQQLYVSGNYTLGRYGELDLSINGPLDNPTNVVAPGPAAIARQDLNDRSRIQLDDGSNAQNPVPPPPYFNADGTLRTGDTVVGSLTGVLGYAFGAYEVQPTGTVTFASDNSRPAVPDVGGSIQVAAFNVLNYFTTLDDSGAICGPSANQDCRGADNASEFGRQKSKIVSAITKMDADVIGLMEIENYPGDVPVADLVSGLNDVAGFGMYAYIATGAVGTDAIRQAIIYQPEAVTPLGEFAVLDSSVDPTFNDDKNRPAIAQTFMDNTTGGVFTVVVNHLKSKGSPCDSLDDPDVGDGQGNCNQTRTKAAKALVNWLGTDPTGIGDPDFLITGDLNSYAMEDPIAAITSARYTDLIGQFKGTGWASGAYSFNFLSQSGYLDHALTTPSMTSQVAGAGFWHINADEPSALDYNDYNQAALYQSDEFRASDHDPVIVGLDLTPITVVQLEALVRYYADTGAITGNKTVKILLDRLERARRYVEKGKTAAYRAQLQSFMNQVQGFAPKFIDQNAADVLSYQAWLLMNQ